MIELINKITSELLNNPGLVVTIVSMNVLISARDFYLDRKFKCQLKDIDKPILLRKTNNNKFKLTNINYDHIKSDEFKKIVDNFKDVLEKNFPAENLAIFSNNINSLEFYNETTPVLIRKGIMAFYTPENNSITFLSKDFLEVIYHELFHASSTIIEGDLIRCGLCQTNKDNYIGVGFNEGFTDYLCLKYFNELPHYEFETYVASNISKIIGDKKMENYYFKVDANGFIDELKQYLSENDVTRLIKGLDFYTKKSRGSRSSSMGEFKDSFTVEAQLIILKLFVSKEIKGLNIPRKDAFEITKIYASSLEYKLGNEKYGFTYSIADEDINNILDEFYSVKEIPNTPQR